MGSDPGSDLKTKNVALEVVEEECRESWLYGAWRHVRSKLKGENCVDSAI